MKRFIVFFLAAAALAACDGPTEGSAGIASVQLSPDDRTLAVNETLTLTVVVRDAKGNEPDADRRAKVEFASDNPAVATVGADGVVTGKSPGSATITATLGGKSGAVVVKVAADPAPCGQGGAVRSLGVGEAVVLGGVTASVICLDGGVAGKEYVAVPFHSGNFGDSPFTVSFATDATVGLNALSLAPSPALAGGLRSDDDFHARLRERSARALGRHRDAALSVSPRRGTGTGTGMGPSLTLNLRSPSLGDQVTVNTSLEPCEKPKNVTARVVAIGERSIVLADVANPASGLTDAEYRAFAAGFDTLVYPTVTGAFGTPEDVDRNGKAVILYTKAVNELTERGSNSYVGGYFHPRDLFPTRNRDGLAACATTNYAEIFYMLVPDPTGSINGTAFSRELILQSSLGTIAHEFQHLINASRRLYVVETTSWNEATWLNEGLSHIAEEVMFYRASGTNPRGNLGSAAVQGTPRTLNAFRTYMDQNIRRYARYLQAPSTESPYDSTEAGANDLATRGASWAFLRYAADRRASDDAVLWRDLVDTDVIGFANLQQALGRDPREWIRDWATSVYTDDFVPTEARFQQPSWRYRSFFNTFPLATQPLTDGFSTQLASGGAAFLRFTVPPAAVGTVRALSGTNPLPSRIYVTVVRTR
ncbi:MAG: Ig-like domain-containing protein [Gemmatimonadetes bacterium]|nr:Ig-like domain-containing protein [Gemmatimonadota bacterium]